MRFLLKASLVAILGASCATARPEMNHNSDDLISASVSHPNRMGSDLKRDANRHPASVLDFFGIKPGMHVADMMAGDGYYTELLSRAVGEDGQVYCQNTAIPLRVFAEAPLTERLLNNRLPNVMRLDTEFKDAGLPTDLDAALLVRFYHDFGWQKVDRKVFNALMFNSLKSGGLFGVVDHHAKEGAGMSEGQRLHRVEAQLVRAEIEAAGFVFEAESQTLFNPDDTLDWKIFSSEHGGQDTTSRFIYLFRKP
ncbi:MAG: putative methyltransferase [Myxococcota bacterium]|jgi:predicted methyltransferase